MNNIYILSRPIRTGKTTELIEWIKRKKNVAGVLTPDVQQKRKMTDIATNIQYDLEVQEVNENSLIVGRFVYDENIFIIGRSILENSIKNPPNLLVIDEIGKLEIERRQGFEPILSSVIEYYKKKCGKLLLLVIRDSLLDKAITHYHLEKALIIQHLSQLL